MWNAVNFLAFCPAVAASNENEIDYYVCNIEIFVCSTISCFLFRAAVISLFPKLLSISILRSLLGIPVMCLGSVWSGLRGVCVVANWGSLGL